ncbi:hypothetical protein BDA96_02G355400 [Sorghum bicolor]|uniref:Uncharacterized protein n=2 Tax=Sorghum bicolor TaxID=4558 RepID=A0A921UUR2_SORBI|nr:hypothetical protein BDA96_02G355400 [Sorghum bicolor]OQU90096.1 hypothetical protein SORBI_3002G339250 [Sorghum bicolor]
MSASPKALLKFMFQPSPSQQSHIKQSLSSLKGVFPTHISSRNLVLRSLFTCMTAPISRSFYISKHPSKIVNLSPSHIVEKDVCPDISSVTD